MSQTSNEPTYVFIKGQGWIIETYPTLVFTRGNQTIRLSQREPVDGERFHNIGGRNNSEALEWVKNHLLNSYSDIGVEWVYYKSRYAGNKNNVVIEIL